MGGLDCRHLISHIKPTEYVPLSLTSIGTPHRGSPFMDWCAVSDSFFSSIKIKSRRRKISDSVNSREKSSSRAHRQTNRVMQRPQPTRVHNPSLLPRRKTPPFQSPNSPRPLRPSFWGSLTPRHTPILRRHTSTMYSTLRHQTTRASSISVSLAACPASTYGIRSGCPRWYSTAWRKRSGTGSARFGRTRDR